MGELVKYENGELSVAEGICAEIAEFEKQALKIELVKKNLKEKLKECMENYGVEKFENSYIKVSYRKPSQRVTIDSKKLKEELPDIYNEYTKTSNVASSITLEVK